MSSIVVVCIIVGSLIAIGIILLALRYRGKNSGKLKAEYEKALKSGNRARALYAGRAYYESTHTASYLTVHDEQAINNDLDSM